MSDRHIPSAQHDAWVLGMLALVGLPALAAFWITSVVVGPDHLSLSIYHHSHLPTLGWLALFGLVWAILLVVALDAVKRVKRLGIPSLAAVGGKGESNPLERSRRQLPWWSREMKERLGVPNDRVVLGIANGNRWRLLAQRSGLLVIGQSGSGKSTGIVIPNLMLAGPVVTTSTKPELIRKTLARRASLGTVYVWDLFGTLPDDLESQVVRIAYPLPQGCADFSTALRRGKALTGETVKAADPHWRVRSGQLIAGLLHAAALSDEPTTETVIGWLQGYDRTKPAEIIADKGGSPAAAKVLASFSSTPPGELGSIFSTASGCLAAFSDEAIGRAEAIGQTIDFEQFLAGGSDSLFLLCSDDMRDAAAPLFLVLLADLHRAILKVSNANRNGRLPRQLLVLADELVNVAPIPDLQSWVSALPGHGVTFVGVVQTGSQLRDRYGSEINFPTLFNTTALFGGSQDIEHLSALETVTGAAELAHLKVNKLPIPEHLADGDRLTTAELSGLSQHKIHIVAAHTPPKVVTSIDWEEVEPFASWGAPPDRSGTGEQFKAVTRFRNRLGLPKPTLVDDSGVPAIESGNESVLSTSVQDGSSRSESSKKHKLVRNRPQQLVEYESRQGKATDQREPKDAMNEAWRELFEPIELIPLKPLEGTVADLRDSAPLPLAKPPTGLWEPQAPIPGTDKNRWPGLCEKCSFRVAPGGGRVSRGASGWLTWDLDCYRETFGTAMSPTSGDHTH